jgi:DNA replication ATP-dependent helicase Dna2
MVFVGDTRQLGPIVHGEAPQGAMSPAASILEQLCEVTPDAQLVMLTQSYRLNEALCAGPARQWYGGALRPVYAKRRLELNTDDRHDILNSIVDPAEPLSVVVVEHRGQTSRAEQEAHVAAQVVARLMERGVKPEQIGVLTPHRQQGALIISALRVALGQGAALPVVDTVERAQGSERDVIVYSMTSSDAGVIEAGFLLEPRRTNVALTRARSKLIVLGSRLLLREYVPIREDAQRRYAQLMGCLRGGAWHDL